MNSSLPAIFVSHGAPDLPIRTGEVQSFLQKQGQSLPKPKAILVVSAHWNTPYPVVSAAPQPRTIHDFSGFSSALYQMTYPVKGAPDLAVRVVELLNRDGLRSEIDQQRGLDHGAWTPLMLMYPQADIPVTQLSIQYDLGSEHHFLVGRSLSPLRDEGVLIIASGGATHNIWAFGDSYTATPPTWVREFDRWLIQAIAQNNIEALLSYRKIAPYAVDNHPTEEHLLPLFVAMGAGGADARGKLLHHSYTYGVFSMAAYAFS